MNFDEKPRAVEVTDPVHAAEFKKIGKYRDPDLPRFTVDLKGRVFAVIDQYKAWRAKRLERETGAEHG